MNWLWFWLILSFVGNFTGFILLHRIPKFKHSFGAKGDEWFVDAVWYTALMFVPFMLICAGQLSPQNRNKIKDSLLLNACLNFICIVLPVVIEHLVEYPKFHIDARDVEQHNSRKRTELFAAFSFASTSFGLSKAYDLTFESGFFSLCLGYAMKVSLEVVDENGNRNPAFISVTYSFCFMVILLRKYLEKNNGNNTRRQDNQSQDSINRAYQSSNNNEGADQNLSAASNADLQDRENVPLFPLAQDQPRRQEISLHSLNGSRKNVSGSQRDLRQESWDINELNWEIVPPRPYNDTSTEDGEEEEDVRSVSNFVVKESRGKRNSHFAEETSTNDSVGKIEEREIPVQGTKNEERDMRSVASSSHEKTDDSTRFGAYEKGNNDQSQESDTQDYERDDNNPLLPKSSLDKDDDDDDDDSGHKSSDGEESDSDDYHGGGECKFGVDWRHKDRSQESDCQEQGGDIPVYLSESNNTEVDLEKMEGGVGPQDGINYYEGIRKPFSDEGTSRPSHDQNDDFSDDDGNAGDDFNSGRGCKVRVGRRGRNECLVNKGRDITDLDNLRSNCEICPLLGSAQQQMQRKFINPVSESPVPRAKISELSDDEGSYVNDLNSRAGSKNGVGQTGMNKCTVKVVKDITNLDESRSANRSFYGRPRECWTHGILVQVRAPPVPAEISKPSEISSASANRIFFGPPSECRTKGKLVLISETPVPTEISIPFEFSNTLENTNFLGLPSEFWTQGGLVQILAMPPPILENTSFLGLPSEFWTRGGLVQVWAMATPTEISKPSGLSSTLENTSFFGSPSKFWIEGGLVQLSAKPTPTEISKPSELPFILANKSLFRLPRECSIHGIPVQISKTLVPVEISKHYELLSRLANGSFFRLPREFWTRRDFVQTWPTPELAEINKLSELLSTTNRSFLGLPSEWDKNIVSVQTSTTPTLSEISKPSNDDKGDSRDEGHDGCDFNTGMGCIPGVGRRGKKKHPLKEGKRSSNFYLLRTCTKVLTFVKNHYREKGKEENVERILGAKNYHQEVENIKGLAAEAVKLLYEEGKEENVIKGLLGATNYHQEVESIKGFVEAVKLLDEEGKEENVIKRLLGPKNYHQEVESFKGFVEAVKLLDEQGKEENVMKNLLGAKNCHQEVESIKGLAEAVNLLGEEGKEENVIKRLLGARNYHREVESIKGLVEAVKLLNEEGKEENVIKRLLGAKNRRRKKSREESIKRLLACR